MSLVEALCDRIVLIDHGKAMLYGPLEEIKRSYGAHSVRLRTPTDPGALPGVTRVEKRDGTLVLTLEQGSPQELLKRLVERDITVESFEVATVPLDEIFIAVVKGEGHA
jgi:ABC-2 type transport system ATP-binding protein